ncbi:MAG TPA: M13 family metallopeptidase [Xanthomonadaceae bacterium]|nr:M13 family metallopeptidase [Xanthomonadaceae bacterium]
MTLSRPLLLALGIALLTFATAPADAAKKRKRAAKAPAVSATCRDYYAEVNADWLKANAVSGSGMQSALGQLAQRARQQQIDLLNADMQAQGGIGKLLGDFWASGLDEAAIERDGAQPIAPLLSRIDAIRREKDIPAAIAALHQVGIPVAFNFSADLDLQDLDRTIGYFSQGGMGLPDPAFYTRNDPQTRAVMARYTDYVSKILALTGSKPADLQADTQAVLGIEGRIAQLARPLAEIADPRGNYAPVDAAALGKQYRHLRLADFLQAQGVKDDRVSLANPQLFAQLDAMVDQLKPAEWKAYLRYQVGAAMAPYLSKAWRDVDFAFRGGVLRGETTPAPRPQQVLDAINRAAGPMLGHDYVARYLTDADRARAQEIATGVRDALGRALARADWMSPAAKAEAQAKLAALRIEVGAPEHDPDFTIQPMGRGSFGANMLIASAWRHREEMRRIGKGNAALRWDVLPQQPALHYDLAHNRLVITAAMLQAPVLDPAQEPAAQYGALGALVGHELTHGFDATGRHVDAKGVVRDWWTPADASAWNAKLAPLVGQYGGYQWPGTTLAVDGTRTRDENAADLAGVELALDAFSAAQPDANDAARRAFFAGWARLWPQQASEDVATRLAAVEVHAPGQARGNATLANLPAFGEAFSCKAGTPMQLPTEQQAAIWR